MLQSFLSHVTIVQVGVLLTLIFLLFSFRKDNTYFLLLSIVGIFTLTEFLVNLCIVQSWNYSLVYNVSILIHNLLWIKLLTNIGKLKFFGTVALGYFLFTVINLLYGEGMASFNVYTFVVGALIYITLFVFESVRQLNKENFDFFTTNEHMLLYTPLFLFITVSAVTGFHDSELGDVEIIGKIPLYSLVNTFGNLIYYGLINIYIYRINKLQHA